VKVNFRRIRLIRQEAAAQEENPEEKRALKVYEDLAMDEKRGEISVNGTPIAQKPKEYELLTILYRTPGQDADAGTYFRRSMWV
jgi:DNA-binding response OmpR family regulator